MKTKHGHLHEYIPHPDPAWSTHLERRLCGFAATQEAIKMSAPERIVEREPPPIQSWSKRNIAASPKRHRETEQAAVVGTEIIIGLSNFLTIITGRTPGPVDDQDREALTESLFRYFNRPPTAPR